MSGRNIPYWNAFCDYYLIQRRAEFRRPSFVAMERHFINFPMGIPNFALRATQRIGKGLGAVLLIRGTDADTYFHALIEQSEEIHKACGEELSWYPVETEKRIAFIKADADPKDENDWSNQHKWIASKLDRLNEVFRPRIERLVGTGNITGS